MRCKPMLRKRERFDNLDNFSCINYNHFQKERELSISFRCILGILDDTRKESKHAQKALVNR